MPNAHSLCCVALNVRSGPISVHLGWIWRLHRILQVPENGSIYNVRVSVITPSKIAQAAPGPALAELQSATEGREDGKDVKACVFFAAFWGGGTSQSCVWSEAASLLGRGLFRAARSTSNVYEGSG